MDNYSSDSSMEGNYCSKPFYSNSISVDDFKSSCSIGSSENCATAAEKDACEPNKNGEHTNERQKQNPCYLEYIETEEEVKNTDLKNDTGIYELYALAKQAIKKEFPETGENEIIKIKTKPKAKSSKKIKRHKTVKFNVKKCGVARPHRRRFSGGNYAFIEEVDSDEWLTVSEQAIKIDASEYEALLDPVDYFNNAVNNAVNKENNEVDATAIEVQDVIETSAKSFDEQHEEEH